MFASGELADMYRTNFLLAKDYNISIEEIEEMIPFERVVYVGIVLDYLEKKKKAMQNI